MSQYEEQDEGVHGLLVKEEADLDYCRCGTYCGSTSPAIIEELHADTEAELVEMAARSLPVHDGSKPDADPQLFIVAKDLSEELRRTFAVRVERVKADRVEKAAEAERVKKKAERKAAAEQLRLQIKRLQSGEELVAKKAALEALERKDN